jgi:CRISPR-associated exonuclease Cas4
MKITGTNFNYYIVCKRKLWLFANGITMEQNSDTVYDGKMLHEFSYPQRAQKYQEIELDGIKIDFFDPQTNTIHEIKRSNSIEKAHKLQLKYYMYRLKRSGISEVNGILEYPALRKKENVELSDKDEKNLEETEHNIEEIIAKEQCPERIKKSFCRKCSYFDFCWSGELQD